MEEIISLKEAQSLFKQITSKEITRNGVEAYVREYAHLGHYELSNIGNRVLRGVHKKHFHYFVSSRFALGYKTPRDIFDNSIRLTAGTQYGGAKGISQKKRSRS